MSGQRLTCLGHGTFSSRGQLCSCTALCPQLIMLITCCWHIVRDLVRSAEFLVHPIYSI